MEGLESANVKNREKKENEKVTQLANTKQWRRKGQIAEGGESREVARGR
tara:strand:- start:505 stop:651 length:147 start_codon:yes stop_codon:yes gene_type:complete